MPSAEKYAKGAKYGKRESRNSVGGQFWFMSSENSMFLAFSLMLNDLTSEHAVEFEIVFFKYSFTLVFHKANEKLRKWKNIQSLPLCKG